MSGKHGRQGSNTIVVVFGVVVAVLVLGGIAFGVRAALSSRAPVPAPRAGAANASAAKKKAASPAPTPISPSAAASSAAVAPAAASARPSAESTRPSGQYVPVLMYHHIMPNPNNNIAITPAYFEKQMKWLHDNGYHTVTMAQFTDFAKTGRRLPDKPVLLTFDDGRMNQLTYAVPVMKRYGFTATFFVVKKWVDSKSSSFLHVAELRKLSEEGFDIESHTSNHMMMRRFKSKSTGQWESYDSMKARLWYPTYGMRTWLSEVIGKPVTAVAYPGGGYDAVSPRLMQDAGYSTAFTTDGGVNSYGKPSRYLLKRWNAGARGLSWGSWKAFFRAP